MNFDDVPGQFYLTAKREDMDVPWILQELRKTYWGGWLTLPTVQTAVRNSLCFGVFERTQSASQQIGFARVVTDHATFAWLCDVVIAKPYRRKGLGRWLVGLVINHPEVRPRACLLCTKDAQKLYRRFGFEPMTAMKRPGGLA